MSESKHEHTWSAVAHIDACHYFTWSHVCMCGASMTSTVERDLDEDPFAVVWMDGGEYPDGPCLRCRDLLEGAVPQQTIRIVLADGTVESDVTADQR